MIEKTHSELSPVAFVKNSLLVIEQTWKTTQDRQRNWFQNIVSVTHRIPTILMVPHVATRALARNKPGLNGIVERNSAVIGYLGLAWGVFAAISTMFSPDINESFVSVVSSLVGVAFAYVGMNIAVENSVKELHLHGIRNIRQGVVSEMNGNRLDTEKLKNRYDEITK